MRINLARFVRKRLLWTASLCLLAFCGEGAFAQTSTLVGQGAGNTEGAGASCGDSAVGYNALYLSPCNGGTSFNTAIGTEALFKNTATDNTALGAYALYSNTSGTLNTAAGYHALFSNQTGGYNSAFGYEALQTSTGAFNAAFGALALQANTSGGADTAVGNSSLAANTSGENNTAVGSNALYSNTTGYWNTAVGGGALNDNTGPVDACYSPPCSDYTGTRNTAVGFNALTANQGGYQNTALGSQALAANTSGIDNLAIGVESMLSNVTGGGNTALGNSALAKNIDGSGNFALGAGALGDNMHGCNQVAVGAASLAQYAGSCANGAVPGNIAIGFSAGAVITQGTNNIDIGSTGVSSDAGVTRIGFDGISYSPGTTGYVGTNKTFISGIYSAAIGGPVSTVYVNASGQLGTSMQSSERFKSDIAAMSGMSESVGRLRPVTFHYKTDPTQTLQYGLIAEEVAKVFPELVIHDRDGNIASVHYEELAPILLAALQEQQHTAQALDGKMRSLEDRNAALTAQMAALEKRQEDQLAAQADQLRELKLEIAALSSLRQPEKSLVASR